MNQIFSFDRFKLMFVHELRSNWRLYLSLFGLSLGIYFAIILFSSVAAYNGVNRAFSLGLISYQETFVETTYEEMIFYYIILFIAGCVVGSKLFSGMKNKPSAISTLMLPASQFEKFFVNWLICVPIFLLVFTGGCLIADYLIWAILSVMFPHCMVQPVGFDLIMNDSSFFVKTMYFYLCVQSLYVLGASIWYRRPIVTTTLVCLALIFAAVILDAILAVYLMTDEAVHRMNSFDFYSEDIPLIAICSLLFCFINYAVAYYRFRENEIIQRW
ncbi:MAG: hypothetical protein J6R27_01580 [Muribaculaceae bacterium]|nr:hypothetical protein [Muribaculaceae bacterium]